MTDTRRFVIGIDEVGRGPLAGPVAVAALCVAKKFQGSLREFFPERLVRDSKKLTAKQREEIFEKMAAPRSGAAILYKVSFASAKLIDRKGIVFALRKALAGSLAALKVYPKDSLVLLDGALRAPSEFKNQRTIIKGDEKEAVIALASIAAKVCRDRKMVQLAGLYPEYGFEKHKGYGTKAHYEKIKKHGLSAIHRRSFLKNFIQRL